MQSVIRNLLFIAWGGSIGAMARYGVANSIYAWLGREFPYGTLVVNVTGSFLMGLLTELMLQRFAVSTDLRAAVLVGFIGAYTTFSTFSLETFFLLEAGAYLRGVANVVVSVGLCLTAIWLGQLLGRSALDGAPLKPALPWGAILILLTGWCLVYALTVLLGLLAAAIRLVPQMQLLAWVGLMGLASVASTLWMGWRVLEGEIEVGTIGFLFGLNSLLAGAAIWSAVKIGEWLWQRALSLS